MTELSKHQPSEGSADRDPLWKSTFDIPKMDCPAEERLVRMALDGEKHVLSLSFDLVERRLDVWHRGEVGSFLGKLEGLRLGARLCETVRAFGLPGEHPKAEARTLWLVLGINAAMFLVEGAAGWMAESTGLLADSLDMLADAAVYGLSVYAVGRPAALRLRAARFAGLVQLVLALGALGEVARRAALGSTPEPGMMMGVASLALVANVTCLVLVGRHRHGGVHMKASWIFSANDVIANLGVVVGGALVAWSGSRLPDLFVGSAVGVVVLAGAIRILRLR